jgi:hypothetical protein
LRVLKFKANVIMGLLKAVAIVTIGVCAVG